ncbi:acyl carrier protein [Amycolatopsis sp. NPDC005003]
MTDQLATIRDFVVGRLRALEPGGIELRDEDDLFALGHVSSLFAVQIVMFVERTFGIAVVGDDLDIANFASITRIDRFVTGHRAGADPTAKTDLTAKA